MPDAGGADTAGGVSVGVDIGGTFTDVVGVDGHGAMRLAQDPDHPVEPERRGARSAGDDARRVGHRGRPRSADSCTAPRSPPTPCSSARARRLGLLTTAGFTDVLEIGRQIPPQRSTSSSLKPETPVFLAPGAVRKGVRRAHVGHGRGRHAARRGLAARQRSTRWSARGSRRSRSASCSPSPIPAHERQRARSDRRDAHPDLMVSLSSRGRSGLPRVRAHRASPAFDAYVKPVLDRYLAEMEQRPRACRRARRRCR